MSARVRDPRPTRATTAVVALLLLLVACGGDDAAEGGTDGAESASGDAATGGVATEAGVEEPTSEPADAVFEGETIEFVVPYEPGGGYDQYARIIAPYLAECLGAEVVPINEPGAGSLLATNQTSVAEPDGTRIQIFNMIGAISAQIAEAEGAQFDLSEFSWLARVSGEPNVLSVGANSEFETFEDLVAADRPVRFVATGPGSSEYVGAAVLSEVYGIEPDVITGFAGSPEAQLALIQGDADAHVLSLDSTLPVVESGDLRPLLVVGAEESDLLPDVPAVTDVPPEEGGQEAITEALVSLVETARAIGAPPGVPADRLTALRDGLACALEDEELVAEAEGQDRPIDPMSGEEIADLIDTVLAAPPEFQTLVRESF